MKILSIIDLAVVMNLPKKADTAGDMYISNGL